VFSQSPTDIIRINYPIELKEGSTKSEKLARTLFFLGGLFGLHRYDFKEARSIKWLIYSLISEPDFILVE